MDVLTKFLSILLKFVKVDTKDAISFTFKNRGVLLLVFIRVRWLISLLIFFEFQMLFFFEFQTFFSKMAPNRTLFKYARSIDITYPVTIVENSKKDTCTSAHYRSLLDLKYCFFSRKIKSL